MDAFFCREALHDISKSREEVKKRNATVVFVHMGTEEDALPFFEKFDLTESDRISDIEQEFYQVFGLARAKTSQLASFRVFLRGFQAGVGKGLGAGSMVGDGFQMPGILIIHKGKRESEYIHKDISDCPDYVEFIDNYLESKS